jgi:hypothetical protein
MEMSPRFEEFVFNPFFMYFCGKLEVTKNELLAIKKSIL